MNKTEIEWCDYTINPVKGLCPVACDYCYARRLYKRFKWNPAIRFEPEVLIDLSVVPEGSKIFIGSTIELFHEYTEQWMPYILACIKRAPWQTSILLTKQPQNLYKYSPFPDNCWVGVSATNGEMAWTASAWLKHIEAGIKFISFEPLLSPIHSKDGRFDLSRAVIEQLDWLIIGARTPYSNKTAPKMSWVQELLVAASNSRNTPVFMKDNLRSVIDHDSLWAGWQLRQEFPNGKIT